MDSENEILRSRKLLKPEFRLPFQTTKFVYKALDEAEKQAMEFYEENKRLKEKLKEAGIE